MKKVLLLLAFSLLFACSDDSNNSNNNSNALHPPTWTHGTWTYTSGGQEMGLKFTSDNVCNVSNGVNNCFKEAIALYEGSDVDEEISNTEYKVDINIGGSNTTIDVIKISATQIGWKLNSTSTLTLTKQ